MEDIDMVGGELAQRILQVGKHRGGGACVALCRDHYTVARSALDRLADNVLGRVGVGGVEEVDAKVEGLAHQCDGLRLGEAGAEPNAAVAATAEPCHADLEARPAEGGIVHVPLSTRCRQRVARNVAQAVAWVKANDLECGRAMPVLRNILTSGLAHAPDWARSPARAQRSAPRRWLPRKAH